MIFIEIGFGWFLLSMIFMMFIGISMILEYDCDKFMSRVKIFIIGIVVIFIVSVILMILSLSTI